MTDDSGKNADTAAVRRFIRFFEEVAALARRMSLGADFTLAESRVIEALGATGSARSGQIAMAAGMDRGQLSRALWRLSDRGFVASVPGSGDRRAHVVALTRDGERAARVLDGRGDSAAETLVAPLTDAERLRLVEAMQTIEALLARSFPGRDQ